MDRSTESSQETRCRQCGGEFANREQLAEHARRAHGVQPVFGEPEVNPVCPRCGSPFDTLELLKEHEAKAH